MRRIEMGGQGGNQVGHGSRFSLIGVDGKKLLRPSGEGSLAAQLHLKAAVRPQDLHTFVTPISDVEESFWIYSDAGRTMELARTLA